MPTRTKARRSGARKARGTARRKSSARRPGSRKTSAHKTSAHKAAADKTSARKTTKRWSNAVTTQSNALDLDKGVFSRRDPKAIARSLKRSAERSRRRKADPYRSALSMLTFYINRAGKKLPAARKRVLEKAKTELRAQFGR